MEWRPQWSSSRPISGGPNIGQEWTQQDAEEPDEETTGSEGAAGAETGARAAVRAPRWKLMLVTLGAFVVALVVGLALGLPAAQIAVLAGVEPDPESPAIPLVGLIATAWALIGTAGAWARRMSQKGRPLRPFFAGPAKAAVVAGLGTGLQLVVLSWLWDLILWATLGQEPALPWSNVATASTGTLVAYFVVGGVAAPIAEEWFFRGCVFGLFKAHGYVAFGTVFSALLFMGGHAPDYYNLPAIFVYGVLLARLYHRNGSLLAPITAHITNNLYVFALLALA